LGHLKGEIEIARGADVRAVAVVSDARISRCVGSADLLGTVARAIVANDQLEIRIGLSEQRLERCDEESLAVVDGEADAQRRILGGFGCHWDRFSLTLAANDTGSRPYLLYGG
jgi:hypothetical protein